jgi:hypothetical protein
MHKLCLLQGGVSVYLVGLIHRVRLKLPGGLGRHPSL